MKYIFISYQFLPVWNKCYLRSTSRYWSFNVTWKDSSTNLSTILLLYCHSMRHSPICQNLFVSFVTFYLSHLSQKDMLTGAAPTGIISAPQDQIILQTLVLRISSIISFHGCWQKKMENVWLLQSQCLKLFNLSCWHNNSQLVNANMCLTGKSICNFSQGQSVIFFLRKRDRWLLFVLNCRVSKLKSLYVLLYLSQWKWPKVNPHPQKKEKIRTKVCTSWFSTGRLHAC